MNIHETNRPRAILSQSDIKAQESKQSNEIQKTVRIDSVVGRNTDSRIEGISKQIESSSQVRPEAVAAAKALLASEGYSVQDQAAETAASILGLIHSL